MEIQKFIRNNIVLVAGVVAPALLMLMFFLASAASHTAPPAPPDIKYDVLMEANAEFQPGRNVNAELFIENGSIYIQYQRVTQGSGSLPKLYLYEAATKKLRQIDCPPPESNDDSLFGKKILLEATKNYKIDTATTSPDGYEFTHMNSNTYRGGIINELFVGSYGGNNYGPALKKDDVYYKLPSNENPYGIRFFGWVVDKQG